MKRRRSILLDEELDRRVERRARARGTTYTEAVREALAKEFWETDENPNQWLLDLIDELRQIGEEDGYRGVPPVPVDSFEARQQMARDRYRHKFGRKPDRSGL
ncbi:MAG: ribbon-helix-helix protein, CopG family [Dehalococcoidia bacterium]